MPNDRYPFLAPLHDAAAAEAALKSRPAIFWEKRGERAALDLFHKAAERVPAYKDFLRKHRIRPASIQTIEDFKQLPTVDKTNYLRAYPLEKLSWDGKLHESWHVYASTSGSTGDPFYFPRHADQTDQYALMAELYLRTQFSIHTRSTLYVDCFAMGAWIGGLFTYQAVERLARRGKYRLHVITPGLHKGEAFQAIKKLGPEYDQVVIGGYPPFIRDFIEEGIGEGIDWKRLKAKFVFSAEGFGERFRDHIAEHASLGNMYRDTLNHYGTVDLGTMAYETPLASFMRRAALSDKSLYGALFAEPSRLPTLAQYLPEHFYFESVYGKGLACTADGGLPLIRYDLNDHGGVRPFNEAWDSLAASIPDTAKALAKARIEDTVFKLPFVHVYERSDFSVVLYGANIYPEHVRAALESRSCARFTTGKCTLRIVESKRGEPRLDIQVELKKGIEPSKDLARIVQRSIVETLLEHNSEYRSNYGSVPKKVTPKIQLWPFGHEKYFSGRGKQKWAEKKRA